MIIRATLELPIMKLLKYRVVLPPRCNNKRRILEVRKAMELLEGLRLRTLHNSHLDLQNLIIVITALVEPDCKPSSHNHWTSILQAPEQVLQISAQPFSHPPPFPMTHNSHMDFNLYLWWSIKRQDQGKKLEELNYPLAAAQFSRELASMEETQA